jgi:hypothetical protein
MITLNRTTLSMLVIAAVMLAGTLWALLFLSDAGDDADRAVSDLATTQRLVQHIQTSRPAVMNGDQPQLASQVPQLLDEAMKSAGIDSETLQRITPQASRRVGDGSQNEARLQLAFNPVSLRQVLLFLSAISRRSATFSVRDIHLSNAAGVTSGLIPAGWTTEITISYLTDSPGDHVSAAMND